MSNSASPLLLPLIPLYGFALAVRELRLRTGLESVRKLRWPVVSVGSLSAGGAGKTPMTIALAKLLSNSGIHVDVLSRGYGRSSNKPMRVKPDGTADEFGDEPLLIARAAGVPVYVAKQRYDVGLLAEADAQAEVMDERQLRVHLLDDGFQHRQLHRDVDIVLLSDTDLTDRLLPAGNMREVLSRAMRAHVIAIPADEPKVEAYLREVIPIDRGTELPRWDGPVWRLRRKMEVPTVDGSVAAFCGIARPEQFFRGLESAGLRVAVRAAFPDHHRFTSRDMARLLTQAKVAGVVALVTTEKDAARLGSLASMITRSLPLLTAGLRIEIDEEDEAVAWLKQHLR